MQCPKTEVKHPHSLEQRIWLVFMNISEHSQLKHKEHGTFRMLGVKRKVSFLPQWGPLAGFFPPHLSPNMPLLSLITTAHSHLLILQASLIFSHHWLLKKLKVGAPCFWKLSFQKSPLLKKTVLFLLARKPTKCSVLYVANQSCFWTTDFIFCVPPSLIVGYCPGSMKLLKDRSLDTGISFRCK